MIELVKTLDGSYTLRNLELNETFHSVFGARTETLYIFVNNISGDYPREINIFEAGFGTGFNALLTCTNLTHFKIYYETIENNLVPLNLLQKFKEKLPVEEQEIYDRIIKAKWNEVTIINDNFRILKVHNDIKTHIFTQKFNIVFYDMFSPDVQPDVWTIDIFEKIYNALENNGIFLTYTAKGLVKRYLREIGFMINRLNGPPGKRHFIKAVKKV